MNYEKNIKILTDFEKVFGNGQSVDFQIKDSGGELKKVSKEEFANWMIEVKDEKNIKSLPRERLIYGASGDIDGITYFTERKGPNGTFKETYYEPRSEAEKNQIIKRNKERKEKENYLLENTETHETTDKRETKSTTNQSTISTSNSNDQNHNHFRTIILTVSILAITSLTVYGISSVIRKKKARK